MPQDMTPSPTPRFEITSFLEGRTTAMGVFEDRFGTLRRRFWVEIMGRWQDGVFLLEETFTYDTGDSEARTWRVVPQPEGRFTATCLDCVGEAQGECTGDSILMRYRFRLKLSGRELVVSFHDRIYRMGDDIAVNRATMSKWGVRLGELCLFFRRDPAVPGPMDRAAA